MKLKTYIAQLSEAERAEYAKRCGTTYSYLNIHVRYARKVARRDLMEALADQSGGNVSKQEVLEHYFGEMAA